MPARGIRNNNPGNIRKGEKWKGLSPIQNDSSFCVFKSPEYGIRALVVLLRNYYQIYELNTVAKIIKRYAPKIENDTYAYIESVSRALGVSPKREINLLNPEVMFKLIQAIIYHENGSQPYEEALLRKVIAENLSEECSCGG